MNLLQAFRVEWLKVRRSPMPWFTALGFLLFPFAISFFMIVLKDPELARRYWLISAKAQITTGGAADWPTYLRLLALSTAMGGFILFSLIASWVFGREFSDRTVKDLLALPTARSTIVLAKFGVIALWGAALAALNCAVGLTLGALIGLPAVSAAVIGQGGVTLALVAILTLALIPPIAFFAGAGHGYLPPMGVTLLLVFLVQVVAQAGWGDYFPWAVPAMYAQNGGLESISYLIVFCAGFLGIVATLGWWEWADHTH